MYVGRCGAQVVVWAPAKLNLFLEVLARRHDGYHEIETLMTAINIFDTLYFAVDPAGRVVLQANWASGRRAQASSGADRCDEGSASDLPQGSDNIVVRAVELLQQRAGTEAGARMVLVKRIPSAAGLGGASSDAAAALVAANASWDLNWPGERLAELAAELGSDVPFFLRSGSAVCRGRDERVQSVHGLGRINFVVVRPPDGLSTKSVYQHHKPSTELRSVRPVIEQGVREGPAAVGRQLFNRLEPAASQLSPSINRLRDHFNRLDLLILGRE